MNGLFEELRTDPDMKDFEYRHAWAEAHLNSMIAMQIKIIREQRDWNQIKLALESQMAQPRISLLEDVNYSAWSLSTLKRIARAYDLRLNVSFEEFGSLEQELSRSGRKSFERRPFTSDPKFSDIDFSLVEETTASRNMTPIDSGQISTVLEGVGWASVSSAANDTGSSVSAMEGVGWVSVSSGPIDIGSSVSAMEGVGWASVSSGPIDTGSSVSVNASTDRSIATKPLSTKTNEPRILKFRSRTANKGWIAAKAI